MSKVCGIGYLGGDTSCINGEKTKPYSIWKSMITRCYSNKDYIGKRNDCYKDVKVCEEWHNYSNFKKWYDENYYEIDGEVMALDKDIIIKRNKIYSPETCVFVPKFINIAMAKGGHGKKNRSMPIGVSFDKRRGKYFSRLRMFGELVHLGTFDSPIKAFDVYKSAKEKYIKRVADEYKDKIPERLYKALYNYKVEITD